MNTLPYWIVVWLLRIIFALGFRTRVERSHNIPSRGSAIICANHISWWDPPFVAVVSRRPIRFMAKEELFGVPVLGWLLRHILAFPVNRKSGDRRAVRVALDVLEHGETVGMFPEGTRKRDGVPQVFLRGAAFLAVRSGAPLVPVGIAGRYGFRSRLRMRVGEPLYPDTNSTNGSDRARAVEELTRELSLRIEELSSD